MFAATVTVMVVLPVAGNFVTDAGADPEPPFASYESVMGFVVDQTLTLESLINPYQVPVEREL